MLIKITLFINVLAYSLIVGQRVFYMLALAHAGKSTQAAACIGSGQLIDRVLNEKMSLVHFIALGASILLTAFSVVNPHGLLFTCSVIALLALVIDTAIGRRANIPVSRGFGLYQVRQSLSIIGFASLVAGIVFGL